MAEILGNANQLGKLKNCFLNYKKHVRPQVEKFLMHKYNKKEEYK